MPSPFSQGAKGASKDALPEGVILITDSILTCDKCFEDVSEGVYYEKYQTLIFECPNGHRNEVKGLEL